jgi:hypothetical protein
MSNNNVSTDSRFLGSLFFQNPIAVVFYTLFSFISSGEGWAPVKKG